MAWECSFWDLEDYLASGADSPDSGFSEKSSGWSEAGVSVFGVSGVVFLAFGLDSFLAFSLISSGFSSLSTFSSVSSTSFLPFFGLEVFFISSNLAILFWNLSRRPAVSTSFCLPV